MVSGGTLHNNLNEFCSKLNRRFFAKKPSTGWLLRVFISTCLQDNNQKKFLNNCKKFLIMLGFQSQNLFLPYLSNFGKEISTLFCF